MQRQAPETAPRLSTGTRKQGQDVPAEKPLPGEQGAGRTSVMTASAQKAANRMGLFKKTPVPVSFVRQVKPILESRCVACHSGPAPRGFSLESKALAFAPGARGARILSGQPEQSLLLVFSSTLGNVAVMPLVGDKLNAAESRTLRQWIEEGAEWPDGEYGLLKPDTGSFRPEHAVIKEEWKARVSVDGGNGRLIKLDFVPVAERARRLRSGYGWLHTAKGAYGVEGYGARGHMQFRNGETMTAGELARWIRRDPRSVPGMTVYLFACETGKGHHPFAQELADALGTTVVAPTEKLWLKHGGGYTVARGKSKTLLGFIPYGEETADPQRPGVMRTFVPSEETRSWMTRGLAAVR